MEPRQARERATNVAARAALDVRLRRLRKYGAAAEDEEHTDDTLRFRWRQSCMAQPCRERVPQRPEHAHMRMPRILGWPAAASTLRERV